MLNYYYVPHCPLMLHLHYNAKKKNKKQKSETEADKIDSHLTTPVRFCCLLVQKKICKILLVQHDDCLEGIALLNDPNCVD